MRKIFILLFVSLFVNTLALADDRTVVKIPADIKGMFLEEMRTHLDNLNEITIAISAGDFEGAAYVAENKMSFGHSAREVMQKKGMSQEKINDNTMKMGKKNGTGRGLGRGQGQGRGMGRFMPEEVREMGQSFHTAAENFAQVARNVGNKPKIADYQKVFTALSEIVDVCSACHSSYRVE